MDGFSLVGSEPGLAGVSRGDVGARRWWCWVGRWLPCTVVRRTGREHVCVYGGRGSALGVVDASNRRVQGSMHGRSRVGLAWGIDPWAWSEAGGEVTGQEAEGALLALSGCPRRACYWRGGVGCFWRDSVGWGRGRVPVRW
jgi:hypothetical protein